MQTLASLLAPFATVVHHRRILLRTTWIQLRGTYAGSMLGMTWVILGPIVLLSLYSVVYAVILRVRPVSMTVTDYVLYVFSGLIPFLAFSAALTAGAFSLSSQKEVLLNTVFPAELVPLRSVLVASVSLPIGLLLLVGGDALLGTFSATWLLVPLVMVLQVMFVTGLCWVLSLLTLVVRDIQQILVYVTMLLLIVSPIAYTPDMIPASFHAIMYGNPLFYFIRSYQSLLIFNQVPPLHIVAIGAAISLASFWVGYAVYHRTKQVFYDYA